MEPTHKHRSCTRFRLFAFSTSKSRKYVCKEECGERCWVGRYYYYKNEIIYIALKMISLSCYSEWLVGSWILFFIVSNARNCTKLDGTIFQGYDLVSTWCGCFWYEVRSQGSVQRTLSHLIHTQASKREEQEVKEANCWQKRHTNGQYKNNNCCI